jgi:isopentenyl-diphosphate delta-isomerase
MTEDEFVHIFCGAHAGAASPNPAEVAECRWVPASALAAEIAAAPERYAPWLRDYVQSFGDEIAAWAPSSCSPGR